MKAAPLVRALSSLGDIDVQLVHTGQHYDHTMAGVFFDGLDIKPAVTLELAHHTPGSQIGSIIAGLWNVFERSSPGMVVVVGDVNSTVGAAIVAKHQGRLLAHVESGLRSFDMSMPEEVNRIMVDAVADLCFCTEESATANLYREGKKHHQVFMVGNVMIDCLIAKMKCLQPSLQSLALAEEQFVLCTLHRPSNVDDPEKLCILLSAITKVGKELNVNVLFPLHPRTERTIGQHRLECHGIKILDPLPYDDMLYLMSKAKLVMTDSGGIQEETSYLKVPCVTLRHNTERPVTVQSGTNWVAGTSDMRRIFSVSMRAAEKDYSELAPIPGWDGLAAERIAKIISDRMGRKKS